MYEDSCPECGAVRVPVEPAAGVSGGSRSVSPVALFFGALLVPPWGLLVGLQHVLRGESRWVSMARCELAGAAMGAIVWGTAVVIAVMQFAVFGPVTAYYRGVWAFDSGKMQDAEYLFRRAVGADPDFEAAWIGLSAAQYARSDVLEAEASARKALSLLGMSKSRRMPRGMTGADLNLQARIGLAAALAAQRRHREAGIEGARIAASLPPNSTQAAQWWTFAREHARAARSSPPAPAPLHRRDAGTERATRR